MQAMADRQGVMYYLVNMTVNCDHYSPMGTYASRQTLMSGAAVKETGLPPEQLDVRLGTISAVGTSPAYSFEG